MRVTLELTENQAEVFQTILDETVRVLTIQEAVTTDALEAPDNTLEEEKNMQAYISKIGAQRILAAEILHTVSQAEKKTSIITDLSDFSKLKKGY